MANYDFDDIKQAALGQWSDILRAFGIEPVKEGKNVPCLLCGGNDRAFWKHSGGKVMQHCRQCGTHFADQLLLELCFAGDFAKMCQELGDYLHCQPSERQHQVRTQAKVAESAGFDMNQAQEKIEQAAQFGAYLTLQPTHPILMRYGIGADCYTAENDESAVFPMKINGQIVDWLMVNDAGQSILSGKLAKGAKLVIKPAGGFNKIFVTAGLVDAYHLFQLGRHANIVVCAGTLSNLQPVADSLAGKHRVIVAVENTLDGLEALQTMRHDFIIPDESGRKFCEIDYRCKPARIHKSGDAGEFYKKALADAGV